MRFWILDCAVHPWREITVGGEGRAQALFAEHFKGMYEKLAPRAAKGFVDRDKEQPAPSNLFEGARAGRERLGEQNPRRFSLYTATAEHPGATAAALATLIGAASLLLSRRRKR